MHIFSYQNGDLVGEDEQTRNIQKLFKLQNSRFQRIFVQNTSELVRLKALDLYFLDLQITNAYELFMGIYEHYVIMQSEMFDILNFEFLCHTTT